MLDFGCWLVRALTLLATLAGIGSAQRLDPVKWSFTAEPASAAPGSRVLGHLTATIETGWHLYALATPPPSPATPPPAPGTPAFEASTKLPRLKKCTAPSELRVPSGNTATLVPLRIRSAAAARPLRARNGCARTRRSGGPSVTTPS